MRTWPVQDAKARFSEILDKCLADGPQILTRRGVEVTVLVPAEQWRLLAASLARTLKDVLLTDDARHDFDLPDRSSIRFRDPPTFD